MTEPQGFRHTDCRPLGYLEKRLSLGAQKCWDRGKMSRIDVSGSRSPWSYGKQCRFQGPYTHRFWFRAHMEAWWSASLTSSEVGNLGVVPFENYWNRLPLWKKKKPKTFYGSLSSRILLLFLPTYSVIGHAWKTYKRLRGEIGPSLCSSCLFAGRVKARDKLLPGKGERYGPKNSVYLQEEYSPLTTQFGVQWEHLMKAKPKVKSILLCP